MQLSVLVSCQPDSLIRKKKAFEREGRSCTLLKQQSHAASRAQAQATQRDCDYKRLQLKYSHVFDEAVLEVGSNIYVSKEYFFPFSGCLNAVSIPSLKI